MCIRDRLLRVNYIQLQRKNNNIHGLIIKTKTILGFKVSQIQVNIIMMCASQSKKLIIGFGFYAKIEIYNNPVICNEIIIIFY